MSNIEHPASLAQSERLVAVFEDSDTWIDILQETLSEHGYTVVKWIATMGEARDAVNQLPELGVKAVIVDGNLSEYEDRGYEGAAICRWIRELDADIQSIGFSGNPEVRNADIQVGKMGGSTKLLEALDTIFVKK